MDTYKFSNLVHYDRNEAGKQQYVYYDVDEPFVIKMTTCIETYIESTKGVDMLMVDFLSGLTNAIETEFGPMTLPQILCTTHAVTTMLVGKDAYVKGYENAMYDMNAEILQQTFGSSQPQATA